MATEEQLEPAHAGTPARSAVDPAAGRWSGDRATGTALLSGWALYISVVAASNLSDLLSSFGWHDWAFRSRNLGYIAKATEVYLREPVVNQVLLAAVIVWETLAAVLLWRAAASWARTRPDRLARARTGLVVLTLLWFGFGIATELLVAYDRGVDESVYWVLAVAVLTTLLTIERVVALPAARSDERVG